MKQIYGYLLALAIFLIILAFFIVPQQGGLISSTQLNAQALDQVPPQYNETLPIQTVDISSSGLYLSPS